MENLKAKNFVREINVLFSDECLSTIPEEVPEAKASKWLHKKIKKYLETEFSDWNVGKFDGYCESSGFIEKDGKYVYISISDIRFWKNWDTNILIRTAAGPKDYRGGRNHYTTVDNIYSDVLKLITEG